MSDIDLDSYLLMCTLDSIEEGVDAKEIQSQCKCKMSFVNCGNDNKEN